MPNAARVRAELLKRCRNVRLQQQRRGKQRRSEHEDGEISDGGASTASSKVVRGFLYDGIWPRRQRHYGYAVGWRGAGGLASRDAVLMGPPRSTSLKGLGGRIGTWVLQSGSEAGA